MKYEIRLVIVTNKATDVRSDIEAYVDYTLHDMLPEARELKIQNIEAKTVTVEKGNWKKWQALTNA